MEDISDKESGSDQQVIEILVQTFGQVLSEDVIAAIVESCGGDLDESANAIMNMNDSNKTHDSNTQINQETQAVNQQLVYTSDYNIGDRSHASQNLDEARAKVAMNYPSSSQSRHGFTSSSSSGHTRRLTSTFGSTTNHSNIIARTDVHWTPQIREILLQHSKGNRLLIIMRGVPGSGKTFLAKKITEMTIGSHWFDYKTHILSTDDFFTNNDIYRFDKSRLHEAHQWNHNRAEAAMDCGLSPVIIDNTNIELWELEPYVRNGIRNGYLIEVVHPNTPWAKKVNQLTKRNVHGVPDYTIKRMLENFDHRVTANYVMKFYKLSYPTNMTPPVKRKVPALKVETLSSENVSEEPKQVKSQNIYAPSFFKNDLDDTKSDRIICIETQIACDKLPSATSEKINVGDQYMSDVPSEIAEEKPQLEQYEEVSKQLEEFAKVEEEWEKGESWSNDAQSSVKAIEDNIIEDKYVEESKPQRKARNQESKPNYRKSEKSKTVNSNSDEIKSIESASENVSTTEKKESIASQISESNTSNFCNPTYIEENEKLRSNVESLLENCQDWSQISMFMSPWEKESKLDNGKPTIRVEKTDSSTCVEVGDSNIDNTTMPYKVLAATARDINLYYMPLDKEKIPEIRMLDKSSMTNEQALAEETTIRCINEEKHFKTFRKMFKNIGKSDLRDIFDRCCGDVNWAVSIVLDGMANKELSVVNSDDSPTSDDEIMEQCQCLAAYDIIPDKKPAASTNSPPDKSVKISQGSTPLKQKKGKKDASVSESSIKLKRQIEKNFVIPDDFYSKNHLKIRKFRRGEVQDSKPDVVENVENDVKTPEDMCPNTPENDGEASTSGCDKHNMNSENSEDDDVEIGEVEKTVNIDLGNHFVAQLDKFFGRKGLEYPPNILPNINIPVSLLNEINALWMESLMDQLDQSSQQAELMLKQDEEFARQLALKESELAQAGKEPEVPDLKEIMDMEFALSLYQKDVEEWRNKEPQDLAAKLTREKLFHLFPNISRDVLSELLMAHDNNFQATLEGLLLSTGNAEILETKNGVNKFLMKKEMERQVKIIEDQKKALSEAEWPYLSKLEKVEMSVVTEYRKEADMHLAKRNLTYQKAREFMGRGMTDVASYYSEIAALHKRRFEYANSLAAASLIQVHASNSTNDLTVDLHYLRVTEACQNLDLFLDAHIQKLRELQNRRRSRTQTLYLITGRGLHSRGPARIKPAVMRRLTERGIAYRERNPGLITARVHAGHHLSYQVA